MVMQCRCQCCQDREGHRLPGLGECLSCLLLQSRLDEARADLNVACEAIQEAMDRINENDKITVPVGFYMYLDDTLRKLGRSRE